MNKPIEFNNQNQVVAPFHGLYSLCDNRGLMLSEAHNLIHQASKLILDYMQLTGFGETHRHCKRWLENAADYAERRSVSIENGTDFRSLTR